MNLMHSPYLLPIHPPSGDWLGETDSLIAPARRASTLMLVLGGLGLLAGLCVGGAAFLPLDELIRRSNIDVSQLQTGGLPPAQYLRLMFILTASFVLGVSATLLILGALVRRGGIASAIVSVVLVGLLTLLVGLQAILQVLQAVLTPNDYMIGSAIFSLLIVAALVLLITWLAAAIRAAGPLQRARQQQVEQWYAMQHHPAWTGYAASNSGGGVDAAIANPTA